jgi:hypothetical protein
VEDYQIVGIFLQLSDFVLFESRFGLDYRLVYATHVWTWVQVIFSQTFPYAVSKIRSPKPLLKSVAPCCRDNRFHALPSETVQTAAGTFVVRAHA